MSFGNMKTKIRGYQEGVHSAGLQMIMTDSGTFQSYVWDVKVGVEIVQFQNEVRVDVATMLDVFTRPDSILTS